MATNLYFSQKVHSEQNLYEDIVIESLKMYGQDVYYLPRDIVNEDRIFGDRHCDITVIGDQTQVDRFTNALKSCFLNDQEIEDWKNKYEFDDPWPKNITKIVN